IFLSKISISFYTISTIIILGIFANDTVLGYYTSANKIIEAMKGLYQPISQAIYPLVSRKINNDILDGIKFIRKAALFICSISFIASLVVFFNSGLIINILLGDQYFHSIDILKIMAFVPFLIVVSNILGVQLMLNLGYKKQFSIITLLAALLGGVLSLILIPIYKAEGTAYVILTVEIFVTLVMGTFIYLKREKYYDAN
ncbi:oligosaccharide flippase family protein, partial [Vibrio eleionomae]|uniref:oligosaccharide flippase family protein n=1 Tax=Vibrio eleionomae TaxID=2653505 RepID=UPI00136A8578